MTLLCATSFPCGANSPGASVSRRPHHWADNSAQRHSLEWLQRGGQALIGQAEQLTLGHHFLQRLHGSFLQPRSTPLPTVLSWVTCWPCSISPISAMLCPLSPRRPSPDHPPSCPRFPNSWSLCALCPHPADARSIPPPPCFPAHLSMPRKPGADGWPSSALGPSSASLLLP